MSQPVEVSPSRGARSSGWRHLDAVSFLTLYLVLLFGVESRLVIQGLGAAGSPALIVGCAGFGWWSFYQAQRPAPTGFGRQPVRIALLAVLCAFLASYAAAMARPISPLEAGTAQIGMVSLLGCLGVALLANDGVPTFARFDQLMGRLVFLGAALATLGIAQFIANDALIRSFTIPGLVANAPLGGLTLRSGFSRPFGTALHPIEFGAVVTTVLPLAIAWARRTTTLSLVVRWLPASLMGLSVMLSISRSAIVCGVAGMVILASGWSAPARRFLIAAVAVVVSVVAVAVPGMLGSLTDLFVSSGDDGSVQSRTGSYPLAFEFFQTAPWFGRGNSTFLPIYRIFDNQYLLLLVDVGLVGLLSVVALFVTGATCARRARRRSDSPTAHEYGQGLFAAIGAGALGLAFFDGFGFPMCNGVVFLVVGLAGALWRLARDGEAHEAQPFINLRHRLRLRRRAAA